MLTVDFDRLDVGPGHRVLDLGCGFGRHAYEAARRGAEVVACDASLPELSDVRQTTRLLVAAGEVAPPSRIDPVQGDATCLPFADAVFDRVVASEVLEHVPDDGAAFAELARVLRPGGVVAVTVPSWLPERVCWALSSDYHAPAVAGGHVRIYTLDELRRGMHRAGLRPGAHHRVHGLHTPYWWLRCAVGPQRDPSATPAVAAYLRLLEWDIVERPLVTRAAERVLAPTMGKSVVLYAAKPVARARERTARERHAA